jgi:hypothetical protein
MKESTVSELQVHSMSDESPVPEVQVLYDVVVPHPLQDQLTALTVQPEVSRLHNWRSIQSQDDEYK